MANVSSSNGLEKCPKLRFPGFDEPWKASKLSDIFEKSTEKNKNGEITNVICNSAKQGLIPQRDYFDKDIANSDNTSGYYIIKQNDFVYNPRKSSDAPYGPVSTYKYSADGIVSPLYLCFRSKGKVNTLFFEWYFKSNVWHRYVYMSGDSGARHDRVSIKDDVFFAMPVNIPSGQEQEHIAKFLELLDHRIEKQRQLVEALKKYKRGAIKQILAKNKTPIKDAIWYNKKIGDLGTFIKAAPLSKSDISEQGYPFILYGELYTTYNEVVYSVVRTTTALVEPIHFSRIGDVLIPTSGETPEEISTASCIMVAGAVLAGDMCIFRSTEIDGRIMSYILNHIINRDVARVAQGKSVVHVQPSEISQIEISFPDLDSQRHIALYFERLDRKIECAAAEHANLNKVKRALLQQLFI